MRKLFASLFAISLFSISDCRALISPTVGNENCRYNGAGTLVELEKCGYGEFIPYL